MLAVRYLSCLYVAVLVAASLALAVVAQIGSYGVRSGVGCNLYDASLVGVECRGFFASGLVEAFLAFPLLVAQVSALAAMSPWMLVPAALMWAPLLFLGYCWARQARAT